MNCYVEYPLPIRRRFHQYFSDMSYAQEQLQLSINRPPRLTMNR